MVQNGDLRTLSSLFGLKKTSDILHYQQNIWTQPATKAVQRYTGVAFEYLDYDGLDSTAQSYIDTHLLIFSNLFGVIKADDMIPDYRLKQGAMVGEIRVDHLYQNALKNCLDEYLTGDEILDLRAGFYDKFYTPSMPYTTLKFIKNKKVVSHWAKAYRGIVVREIAKAQCQSIEAFMKLPIENLVIQEILTKKNHTQIVCAV